METMFTFLVLLVGAVQDDWETGPPAYHSFDPQLDPAVLIEDEVVTLRNRGILVSRQAASSVDLSFDWTWTEGEERGRYHDHLCIAIGTDGKQRPWACEVDHGIIVRLNPGSGAVQIEEMESGHDPVILRQKTGFTFARGTTYGVRLVQRGRAIKIAVNDEIAATTTLPHEVEGKVAIYNRESVSAVPKASRLQRLRLH